MYFDLCVSRAPKGALDKWAQLAGEDSYLFENLLPFYKKSARFTPPSSARLSNSTTLFDDTLWDPDGGPIQVGYPNWVNPFGYAYSPLAIDSETQTRSSAETAYLREALVKTTNMNVYKNTMALKLVLDGKRAAGAIVTSGGVEYQLNATREVIISAGTVRQTTQVSKATIQVLT